MDFNEAFNFQERQIISGYLSLMREKPHAKITVKELSERCVIARTTFYRFFEDTYDLLERLEQYLLGELVLYRPLMNGSTTGLQSSGVAGKPYESIRHFFGMGIYLRKLATNYERERRPLLQGQTCETTARRAWSHDERRGGSKR